MSPNLPTGHREHTVCPVSLAKVPGEQRSQETLAEFADLEPVGQAGEIKKKVSVSYGHSVGVMW